MKVLLINHFPLTGSGSGVYTKNIANGLIKKGHQVHIIMPENENIIQNDTNIKLHPVYFQGKEQIDDALPFNFPCFTTHPRSNQTFYDLTKKEYESYQKAFKLAIEQELKTFKPDVIHSGHLWTLSSLASDYNPPLIVTAHGTDLLGYKKTTRFIKEAKKAYNKAAKIITVSKDNNQIIKDIFGNNNKVITIPNGYNSDIFYHKNYDRITVLNELNINKSYEHIVCYAGKFTDIKGIDILLKAAQIYQNDNTLTLLCGDGILFDNMKSLATKLNLKNIYFLGNQSHDILRKIYNISDVSIVPSRSEAFGLVVIEALACGTPVIGSRVGGIAGILNENIGMLFENENYQELAENIIKILANKHRYDAKYISNYAFQNYSEDNFIPQLLDIYQDSINKHKN